MLAKAADIGLVIYGGEQHAMVARRGMQKHLMDQAHQRRSIFVRHQFWRCDRLRLCQVDVVLDGCRFPGLCAGTHELVSLALFTGFTGARGNTASTGIPSVCLMSSALLTDESKRCATNTKLVLSPVASRNENPIPLSSGVALSSGTCAGSAIVTFSIPFASSESPMRASSRLLMYSKYLSSADLSFCSRSRCRMLLSS